MESGGLAALSQVQTRVIQVPDGIYELELIEAASREPGLQNPLIPLLMTPIGMPQK